MVSSADTGMSALERIMGDLPDMSVDLIISKLKQMPKTMDMKCVLYVPEDYDISDATNVVCMALGINIVRSDASEVLLEEAELALQDKE